MSQSQSQALSTQPGTSILNPWTQQQLQADATASAALRQLGQRYSQQIAALSAVPVFGQPANINVPVQNVGLITKFWVEVVITITNPSGGSTLTRTNMAPWNVLSSIIYTDPNNYQRINTTGWHLAAVTAMRHRRVPGAAVATDTPSGYGAVLAPIAATASIPANSSGTIRAIFEIPLAYSRNSLKGGVFSGAVFATQSLQLVINPALAITGTDPVASCYTGANGSAPPTFTATVTAWQDYWDGFPLSLLQNLSPDLSTIYELKTSAFTTLAVNLDNYFRFSNLRSFLSAVIYFDNGGASNAGSDVNYFALQSANQTTLWKRDVNLQSYLTRQQFGDDFPSQMYGFDFREAPINTAAEGNTVLSMNPSSVAGGAYALVGWEDLGTSAVLASAPSLAGNAGTSP